MGDGLEWVISWCLLVGDDRVAVLQRAKAPSRLGWGLLLPLLRSVDVPLGRVTFRLRGSVAVVGVRVEEDATGQHEDRLPSGSLGDLPLPLGRRAVEEDVVLRSGADRGQ